MDTIADFLTSIRNASARAKDRVDVPASRMKLEIVRLLKEEGFVSNFKSLYSNEGKRSTLRVFLKYSPTKEPIIRNLRRVSKPGLRVYRSYNDIPRVRGGFAVTIISTSKGVVTDRQAKKMKVGGEILCQVW